MLYKHSCTRHFVTRHWRTRHYVTEVQVSSVWDQKLAGFSHIEGYIKNDFQEDGFNQQDLQEGVSKSGCLAPYSHILSSSAVHLHEVLLTKEFVSILYNKKKHTIVRA